MPSKYNRKDTVPALVFKRENPELYKKIIEEYAPVFDKITAIEIWESDWKKI